MAKGFLRRAEAYRYVKLLQDLDEPTADDIATTNALLNVMRNGPEHELQCGMLDAVLTGEAPPHGLEHVRLLSTSAKVDFQSHFHARFFRLMLQFCNDHNPLNDIVFYGYGRQPPGAVFISPTGSTVSHSHFLRHGIYYGSSDHHRGQNSRFGYINNRVPVIIRRIYKTTVEVMGEEHEFVAVMVQQLIAPERRPLFPWDFWDEYLGIDAWEVDQFGQLEAVPADAFTGVVALSDIEMSYGHYWLTIVMVNTEPEDLAEN
ncbi:hypothetical protein FRC08_007410 [Ceratobasidium sp. 394]|nr:hypothetical protein FRC08_007410 [Ceratobasidium sp. 394]